MLKIPYNKDLTLPEAPLGKMNLYPWDNAGYTPEATLKMVYNESALRVCLYAAVETPTVLTNQDDGPVWEDDCLELFLAPYAEDPDYINFECNALGAMVIGKAASRADRQNLIAALKPQMGVYTVNYPGKGFEVHYTLPLAALAELYNKPLLKKGDMMRLNAYKCGEATPIPHFGMLFPIENPTPDFHRPEFFQEAVLD
jgi:hypothetical protein